MESEKAEVKQRGSFEDCLFIGNEREKELIALFQSEGQKAISVPGKFSGYDFFVADTKKGYEVKQDWKAKHSGNLVVEVEMYGKRSGLMATTADCWIFDSGLEFIFITPEVLKDLIVENNPLKRTITGKGDDSSKTAYLLDVDVVKSYAHRIVVSLRHEKHEAQG
jgi:hypothetical protein